VRRLSQLLHKNNRVYFMVCLVRSTKLNLTDCLLVSSLKLRDKASSPKRGYLHSNRQLDNLVSAPPYRVSFLLCSMHAVHAFFSISVFLSCFATLRCVFSTPFYMTSPSTLSFSIPLLS